MKRLLILTIVLSTILSSARADQRILHNGIRLPQKWPPRIEKLTRDPLPVPYLKSPPAVIPIDVGRQLFVDDFLIDRTTLKRTFHATRPHTANPLLQPDRSWEQTGTYHPTRTISYISTTPAPTPPTAAATGAGPESDWPPCPSAASWHSIPKTIPARAFCKPNSYHSKAKHYWSMPKCPKTVYKSNCSTHKATCCPSSGTTTVAWLKTIPCDIESSGKQEETQSRSATAQTRRPLSVSNSNTANCMLSR